MPKRSHCISVRMNSDELRQLNKWRGKIRRGTYLRLLFNGSQPVNVPDVNLKAYTSLARSASNLNQIAHKLNMSHHVEIEVTLEALRQFRQCLIGMTE